MMDAIKFCKHFDRFQEECYEIAADHGFHDDDEAMSPATLGAVKLALIHGEVSDALEELREPGDVYAPSEHDLDGVLAIEEEMANIIIRVADLAHTLGLDLSNAIVAKMDFNRTRPFKHGKAF